MTPLTDEQIDRLEGRELDEAVALATDWFHGHWERDQKPCNDYWYPPEPTDIDIGGREAHGAPRKFHADLGAAMGLLLQFTSDSCHSMLTHVYESGGQAWLSVYEGVLALHDGKPLASGSKSEAATTLCRAYLKLKNRSDGR